MKYHALADFSFLNMFLKYLHSEPNDTKERAYYEAFEVYAMERSSYMETSFTSQADVDQAYARLQTLHNEAVLKEQYDAQAFELLYEIPPKAKVNAVPVLCLQLNETFDKDLKNYLATGLGFFAYGAFLEKEKQKKKDF